MPALERLGHDLVVLRKVRSASAAAVDAVTAQVDLEHLAHCCGLPATNSPPAVDERRAAGVGLRGTEEDFRAALPQAQGHCSALASSAVPQAPRVVYSVRSSLSAAARQAKRAVLRLVDQST